MTPTANHHMDHKILKIYLKSASIEVPDMPHLPPEAQTPQIGVDMQTLASPARPGALECVLRIALQAKLQGKHLFVIEVCEAGIFEVSLSSDEDAHRFVRKVSASTLFPYARKDLAMLAVSAGFQPVLLDHIDFDALLNQVIQAHREVKKVVNLPANVLVAKPVAQPQAQPSVSDEDVWPSTLPSVIEPDSPLTAALAPELQNTTKSDFSRRRWTPALAGLLIFGLAGLYWKWADVVEALSPAQKGIQAQSNSAPPALQHVAPGPTLPPYWQGLTTSSLQLLKEQPPEWYALDLGASDTTDSLETRLPVDVSHPLYVLRAGDVQVRMAYGVFPSRALADVALENLGKSQPELKATVTTVGQLLKAERQN